MDAYEKFLHSIGIAFEWSVDKDTKTSGVYKTKTKDLRSKTLKCLPRLRVIILKTRIN